MNEQMEVSIHALAAGNEHKTIRMSGIIKGKKVTRLIDSGSTYCFLDEQLAGELKLNTMGQN